MLCNQYKDGMLIQLAHKTKFKVENIRTKKDILH